MLPVVSEMTSSKFINRSQSEIWHAMAEMYLIAFQLTAGKLAGQVGVKWQTANASFQGHEVGANEHCVD